VPEYWVVDETGWVKQGTHSVGVQHQYCGAVGKQANCQVCVQLVVTDGYAALPAAGRLYLPQSWCDDDARLRAARVPSDVRFQTKPEIALELIRQTLSKGVVTPAPVLGDSVYGDHPAFVPACVRWAWSTRCMSVGANWPGAFHRPIGTTTPRPKPASTLRIPSPRHPGAPHTGRTRRDTSIKPDSPGRRCGSRLSPAPTLRRSGSSWIGPNSKTSPII